MTYALLYKPVMFQGGTGVCKTPADSMVGSIPTTGTWDWCNGSTRASKPLGAGSIPASHANGLW